MTNSTKEEIIARNRWEDTGMLDGLETETDKERICLYGASNRPQNWLAFYNSLRANTIDFEIIFVGDVYPVVSLPENMRFIYSSVKPAQCHHIAILNSRSELCMQVCDDIILSPHALDNIYELYKQQHNYKTLTAPITCPPGEIENIAWLQWGAYFCGISKRYYKELGGFDTRFIFSQHETDLQLRALIDGATMVWVHNAWWYELPRKDDKIRACTDNNVGFIDWQFLEDLWFEESSDRKYGHRYIFTEKRADVLKSYRNNSTLLTESQGFSGRWNKNKQWDRNLDSLPIVTAASFTKSDNGDRNIYDLIARFGYNTIGQRHTIKQPPPPPKTKPSGIPPTIG